MGVIFPGWHGLRPRETGRIAGQCPRDDRHGDRRLVAERAVDVLGPLSRGDSARCERHPPPDPFGGSRIVGRLLQQRSDSAREARGHVSTALDERAPGLLVFDAENRYLESWRVRGRSRSARRKSASPPATHLASRTVAAPTRAAAGEVTPRHARSLGGRRARRCNLPPFARTSKRGQHTGCTLITVSLDLVHEGRRHLGRHLWQLKRNQQGRRKLFEVGGIAEELGRRRGSRGTRRSTGLQRRPVVGQTEGLTWAKRYAARRRNEVAAPMKTQARGGSL